MTSYEEVDSSDRVQEHAFDPEVLTTEDRRATCSWISMVGT
jgi:hypothetical protein